MISTNLNVCSLFLKRLRKLWTTICMKTSEEVFQNHVSKPCSKTNKYINHVPKINSKIYLLEHDDPCNDVIIQFLF